MKVFGILSDERAFRSKSPAMHNHVLRQNGVAGVYVPFSVPQHMLGRAVEGLRALGIAGANVTVPYKEQVMPCLDRLSPEVEAIGAVNTIVRNGEEMIGRNTDADGFAAALADAGARVAGAEALVLGAGGAAKAAGYALIRSGAARVTLAGRDPDRVKRTAKALGTDYVTMKDLAGKKVNADLLVNATSVSAPSESPEMSAWLERLDVRACRLVFDLNYGRAENMWQRLAGSLGTRFEDGLSMLAHQARQSFFMWTGLEVDVDQFKAGLREGV